MPAGRVRQQQAYEQGLLALWQPYLTDETAPQAVLGRRMAEHLPALFVFVADPAVPPDNNAAERSLRPLVTARKISGGTRSADGSATKLALATLDAAEDQLVDALATVEGDPPRVASLAGFEWITSIPLNAT
jgi:hypothetical protein